MSHHAITAALMEELGSNFFEADLLTALASSPELLSVLKDMQGGRVAVALVRLQGVPDEVIDMILRAGASLLLNMALMTQLAAIRLEAMAAESDEQSS